MTGYNWVVTVNALAMSSLSAIVPDGAVTSPREDLISALAADKLAGKSASALFGYVFDKLAGKGVFAFDQLIGEVSLTLESAMPGVAENAPAFLFQPLVIARSFGE